MKQSKIAKMNFMALCCIIGLLSKKLMNPFANIITDALRIPGGVSTGFAIMFIIIAVELVQEKHSGSLMSFMQGILALMLGRVGSMGAFMPLAYLIPGIVIDLCYMMMKHFPFKERFMITNSLAAMSASLFANLLVFRLSGIVLILYLSISALFGACYGWFGSILVERLSKVITLRRTV